MKRWPFHVSQDTFAHTLQKECGHTPDHLQLWSEDQISRCIKGALGTFTSVLWTVHLWSDHPGWMLIPGVHCLTLMSHRVWGKMSVFETFTKTLVSPLSIAGYSEWHISISLYYFMREEQVSLRNFGRHTWPFPLSLWRNPHSSMESYGCTFPVMFVNPFAWYVAGGFPSQKDSMTAYIQPLGC